MTRLTWIETDEILRRIMMKKNAENWFQKNNIKNKQQVRKEKKTMFEMVVIIITTTDWFNIVNVQAYQTKW